MFILLAPHKTSTAKRYGQYVYMVSKVKLQKAFMLISTGFLLKKEKNVLLVWFGFYCLVQTTERATNETAEFFKIFSNEFLFFLRLSTDNKQKTESNLTFIFFLEKHFEIFEVFQFVITIASIPRVKKNTKLVLYLNGKISNCIANLHYNQPFKIDNNKKYYKK